MFVGDLSSRVSAVAANFAGSAATPGVGLQPAPVGPAGSCLNRRQYRQARHG